MRLNKQKANECQTWFLLSFSRRPDIRPDTTSSAAAQFTLGSSCWRNPHQFKTTFSPVLLQTAMSWFKGFINEGIEKEKKNRKEPDVFARSVTALNIKCISRIWCWSGICLFQSNKLGMKQSPTKRATAVEHPFRLPLSAFSLQFEERFLLTSSSQDWNGDPKGSFGFWVEAKL